MTRAETVSSVALWYGVLAGPLVWSVQLILVFGLPEAVVCAPASGPGTTFRGVGIGTLIQITNAVATALTLAALIVAYLSYKRLRDRDPTEGRRARWMAVAGMFNSSLFLMLTALKFASPIVLSPCGTSP